MGRWTGPRHRSWGWVGRPSLWHGRLHILESHLGSIATVLAAPQSDLGIKSPLQSSWGIILCLSFYKEFLKWVPEVTPSSAPCSLYKEFLKWVPEMTRSLGPLSTRSSWNGYLKWPRHQDHALSTRSSWNGFLKWPRHQGHARVPENRKFLCSGCLHRGQRYWFLFLNCESVSSMASARCASLKVCACGTYTLTQPVPSLPFLPAWSARPLDRLCERQLNECAEKCTLCVCVCVCRNAI